MAALYSWAIQYMMPKRIISHSSYMLLTFAFGESMSQDILICRTIFHSFCHQSLFKFTFTYMYGSASVIVLMFGYCTRNIFFMIFFTLTCYAFSIAMRMPENLLFAQ